METKFEFRKLCSKDIFPMLGILNKIGFKEFKDAFHGINSEGKNIESVGMEVVFGIGGVILENLPKCEKEIYAMLASVSGMTEKEISEMELANFAELIIEFVKNPDFTDFFKVVSKLFKSGT